MNNFLHLVVLLKADHEWGELGCVELDVVQSCGQPVGFSQLPRKECQDNRHFQLVRKCPSWSEYLHCLLRIVIFQ